MRKVGLVIGMAAGFVVAVLFPFGTSAFALLVAGLAALIAANEYSAHGEWLRDEGEDEDEGCVGGCCRGLED